VYLHIHCPPGVRLSEHGIFKTPTPAREYAMRHAIKFCVILIGAVPGMGDRAPAQCFVCSDSNNNTAVGANALSRNSAADNTASGYSALYSNSTGTSNSAIGFESLYANSTGNQNTASGFRALYSNTADDNSALGFAALLDNKTGDRNSALGSQALFHSGGTGNDAVGYQALYGNTTGNNNVAVGYQAGYYQTTGSDNIYIGNLGVAGENGAIRVGTASQQSGAFIAGIENTKLTGSAVYVTASGQLGVLASSERYKTDIAPISTSTEKLQQLHPVSFHLKADPKGPVQYGLIAEEVNKVYPELVIRDEAGKIQGVHYEELAPMLLNEMQKQQSRIAVLDAKIAKLEQMNESMQAATTKLLAKDDRVAMR
jgi:Chaperone of endosialidase